jgi:hypothetical protein
LHSSADGASWLPAFNLQTLSDKLVKLACFVPEEFARQPRAVSEVDRQKATELRQLLQAHLSWKKYCLKLFTIISCSWQLG